MYSSARPNSLHLDLVFYEMIIKELEFSAATSTILAIAVGLMLAAGCALSSQMRCTCILTFPAFCGKSGRGALKALVIAYIIAGPVQNIIVNSKEVIRVFACSTMLTFNLTKTKFVLMFKPFKDALLSVKVDTSEVKETLQTVRDVAAPIASEITGKKELNFTKEINDYIDEMQNETKKRSEITDKKYDIKKAKDRNKEIELDYLKKLEYRCEGVMSAAGAKCRKIFAKAYQDCEDAVSWMVSWALCWPMKLTFVCNVVQVLGGLDACDASSEITSGFGKGYNFLMSSKNMVASEFKPPRLQFKIPRPNIPMDHSIKIALEMITASVIILISRLYYAALDLVRRHGKIEYHQSGYHDLTITVKGTGMVASVVKSIIKSFNFRHRISQNYTNEACLPQPHLLETKAIKMIYGIYVIIFILLIFEGYFLRVRRVICAYFYPKREKRRTLYLYNETLKQRISFYRYMQKKVKKMIRDNKLIQDDSLLLMVKMKFPRRLGWLHWFASCRRKCLICSETESRKEAERYECPECLYIYCLECWQDIGKSCYVCKPPTTDDDSADEPQPADD